MTQDSKENNTKETLFFFNNESTCKLEPKHPWVSFLGLISIREIMPPQNKGKNSSTLHHTKVDFRSHAPRDKCF